MTEIKVKSLRVLGKLNPSDPRYRGNPDLFIEQYVVSTLYNHSQGEVSPYFEGLRNKRIMATECLTDGRIFLPPRGYCHECLAETTWIDYTKEAGKSNIETSSIFHFSGEAWLDKLPLIMGFIQCGESSTTLPAIIRLTEKRETEKRYLKTLTDKGRALELNGKSVVPRFVRRPKGIASDLYFVVNDPDFIASLEE